MQVQIQGPGKLLSFGTELKLNEIYHAIVSAHLPQTGLQQTKQALGLCLTAHVCANLTWEFLAQPTEGKEKKKKNMVCTKIRIAGYKEVVSRFGPMFSLPQFQKVFNTQ